ncbi:MAG: GNAT family N-acetyltransferase [Ignavibacteriaceae bacterium]|nr:GNAT family N-acetyltransferase [Ignavibacteriaceae bacterium]
MATDISLRRAQAKDIDFIIETIIEAEKSFSNKISYCQIFSLSEVELIKMFQKILSADIKGQELCYSEYLVAEDDANYVGACASWVEGTEGFNSSVLKANILIEYMGSEKINEAQHLFKYLHQINIERELNTLQIVNAYIKPDYRGRGLISRLISEHIEQQKINYPFIKKVQLRPTGTNESAYKAYNKMGFEFVLEKKVEEDFILDFIPSKSKILMEKYLE